MVKTKVSKKKGPPTDSDSDDDYVGDPDEEVLGNFLRWIILFIYIEVMPRVS